MPDQCMALNDVAQFCALCTSPVGGNTLALRKHMFFLNLFITLEITRKVQAHYKTNDDSNQD